MTKHITVDTMALQRVLTALANAVATINDLNSNYGAEAVDAVAKEGKEALAAALGHPTERIELDPAGVRKVKMTVLEYKAVQVINTIKALCDGGSIQLPVGVQIDIDVVLGVATTRRVGVR